MGMSLWELGLIILEEEGTAHSYDREAWSGPEPVSRVGQTTGQGSSVLYHESDQWIRNSSDV